MKKKVTFAAICACVFAALCFALVGCGGSSNSSVDSSNASSTSGSASAASSEPTFITSGKIISVSDMECPPFSSYKEGTSEPEGFEVDLMKAVAEKMGLESEWLPKMDFSAIIPLIKQGGKADVGVANFTITDERKQEIDFTDPYYTANVAFVTKADTTAKSTEDFNQEGIRVGAQDGTTGEAWVKENLPKATLVNMTSPNAMLSVRSAGEGSQALDAMVCDLPVAEGLIKSTYSDLKVFESIATGDEFGIAVSKDNPALTKKLNEVLAELKKDGTIDQLVEKWLS